MYLMSNRFESRARESKVFIVKLVTIGKFDRA